MRTSGAPSRSPQRGESGAGALREPRHSIVQPLHADLVEEREAGVERRDAQEVEGAVLEALGPGAQLVVSVGDRGANHRAAREPRPAQSLERRAPHQQGAEPGGIAEHLVEREGDEVGGYPPQTQGVRGHERRGVEEHVEAALAGSGHQLERVAQASEVRLRGESEEPTVGARRGRVEDLERGARSQVAVQRYVAHRRTSAAGELTHSMHRVVVVGGEHAGAPRRERVALGDQLDRGAGVGAEAHQRTPDRWCRSAAGHGGAPPRRSRSRRATDRSPSAGSPNSPWASRSWCAASCELP